MIRRRWIGNGVLAAALLLGGCAGSVSTPAFWTSAADYPRGYLNGLPPPTASAFVPPPPVTGGPLDRVDRGSSRAERALMTTLRGRLAVLDATIGTPDAPRAFECALGTSFDPALAPTLARLLARVLPDIEAVQASVKRGGAFRLRPYVAEGGPTCVPGAALSKSSSYPSGHAAIGWTWALILTELAPDRADELLARGAAYGRSRAICGFHYDSDIAAGRTVGGALFARYQSLPTFGADLARARRELTKLRARHGPAQRCAAEAAAIALAAG